MSGVFRILLVCTGNICRSAQAEQLIRARLERNFPGLESSVLVESAGTSALVGSAMPGQAAALSAQHGGDPADHEGRQLVVEQVKAADLILGMAAEHRSAVVRLLPRASRNTFTLTEFAALLRDAEQNAQLPPGDLEVLGPTDKLRTGVKWASTRRGYLLPLEGAASGDVVDPYRRSDEVYSESAGQIVEALDLVERAAVELARRINP